MKAVVMEGKKRICVVLCEDGTFRKIRGSYKVGDTIEVRISDFITAESASNSLKKSFPLLYGFAAAAALTLGVGYYETSVACSYVTLDATPSIEYTLNRLDKVIKVEALNEEAQPIIETLTHQGVKYNSINDAIDMTVEVLRANDYLTEENNEILIDVVSESGNRSEKLSNQVKNSAAGADSSLSLSVLKSDKEDRASAKGSGISTGQFRAIKEGRASLGSTVGAGSGVASTSPATASPAGNSAKKPVATKPTPATSSDNSQASEAANTPAYTPSAQASASPAPAPKPSRKKKKKASEASTSPSSDTEVAAASTDKSGDASSAATSSEASKDNSGEASSTPAENTEAPTDGATNTDPAPVPEPETPTENPDPGNDNPAPGDGGETPAPAPNPEPAPTPPADPQPAPENPDPTDEPTLPELPDPGPNPEDAVITPAPNLPESAPDSGFSSTTAETDSAAEDDAAAESS